MEMRFQRVASAAGPVGPVIVVLAAEAHGAVQLELDAEGRRGLEELARGAEVTLPRRTADRFVLLDRLRLGGPWLLAAVVVAFRHGRAPCPVRFPGEG